MRVFWQPIAKLSQAETRLFASILTIAPERLSHHQNRPLPFPFGLSCGNFQDGLMHSSSKLSDIRLILRVHVAASGEGILAITIGSKVFCYHAKNNAGRLSRIRRFGLFAAHKEITPHMSAGWRHLSGRRTRNQ